MEQDQIAGAVAMVARDGQVAYFERFGMADIDDGEAMETDTLFRLASMTQRFPPDQINLQSKFTAAVYRAIIH